MSRSLVRVVLVGALVSLTAAVTSAQSTATSTETKNFEVIAVAGNTVVVKLPEGTREITVPEAFRFTVGGQQVTVHDLKAGMTGTATITTRTTTTPVTVTEVKNGQVVMVSGSNLYVRTDGDVKMFTQSQIDKRGISIMREGKPAQLSEFRPGDTLSATIVSTAPPKIVTEREVQALVNRAAPAAAAARQAPAPVASSPAPSAPAPAPVATTARALPKTASSLSLVALLGLTSLAFAATLRVRRRRQEI